MTIRKCPSCGAVVPEGFRFCTECGISIPEDLQPMEDNCAEPVIAPAPEYQPAPVMAQPAPEYQPVPVMEPPVQTPPYQQPAPEKGKKEKSNKEKPVNTMLGLVAGTKFEPVTAGGFVGISFLMMIPVVNLILLIVWACGGCRKINKRNWARAQLILLLISLVCLLLFGLMIYGVLRAIGIDLKAVFEGNFDSVFAILGF